MSKEYVKVKAATLKMIIQKVPFKERKKNNFLKIIHVTLLVWRRILNFVATLLYNPYYLKA